MIAACASPSASSSWPLSPVTHRRRPIAWDFEQYARLLAAARAERDEWYAAVCLAGEAELRVGEIKALRWREDVDLIARTITVNQQTCRGSHVAARPAPETALVGTTR